MASGDSNGRPGSGGSRSFDFGTDDVLCAYDDYAAPLKETPFSSNSVKRSPTDPSVKDFHESRMGRPAVNVYGQQEGYSKEDVISAVDKCMKKYADNLLLFLEGISGRLSQLELYCYKIERSIGDLRSDMVRDQTEKDTQLKSLEKHLQEVHRSVQILRDKQELAETHKELAKFQLQKDSTNTQKSDEGVVPSVSVSEANRHDETPDLPNQHLALVPRQASAPLPLPAIASEQNQTYKEQPMQQGAPPSGNMPQGRYLLNQPSSYYAKRPPLPHDQQNQHQQLELQYVQPRPQFQDQVSPQQQPFPQYQQQWSQPSPQQFSQQSAQPQQLPSLPQSRPQTPTSYPPYPTNQPTGQIAETYPGSMAMQIPYSTIPHPGGNRADAISYGYGGQGSNTSQPLQHHNIQQQPQPQGSQSSLGQSSLGPTLSKSGYTLSSYLPQQNLQGYNTVYSSMDPSRGSPSQNYQSGSYPPSNMPSLQNQHLHPNNIAGLPHSGPQPVRNHSYGEMVEKAVSMGYPRDHVVGVIHRIAETGQPFDFNVLLDRLNAPAVGASPRAGWSG